MIDITHKSSTLRTAIASAIVKLGKKATMDAIINKTVPKGDVLEMAKTAGLFAVKNTSNSIPDCHPLPVEFTGIDYQLHEANLEIEILITVKTIYRTGVEVEAMHGASIIALTMYDMLKPIDKNIEIQRIRLVKKTGGKSQYLNRTKRQFSSAVIVCSDSVAAGNKEDKAGLAIQSKLKANNVSLNAYSIIPDEKSEIESKVNEHVSQGMDLIIFTGGTGLSPRDVTPETIAPMLERSIPGVAEAIRKYGQDRIPFSMLSRSICGTIGGSIILTLPGSTKGASESMDAIFPAILHSFKVLKGLRHD